MTSGLPGGKNYESTFDSPLDGQEFDSVQAVDIRPSRFANRFNGTRSHAPKAQPRNRSQVSNQFLLPFICHLCFEKGHIKPNCPYHDVATEPQYLRYFQSNWDSLASWVQIFVIERDRTGRLPT